MKILFLGLFILCSLSVLRAQDNKAQLVGDFIANVMTIDKGDLNEDSPIASVNQLAFVKADTSIVITKDNMAESLQDAEDYRACLITVGVHTIVLVMDYSIGVSSGSWGCKMPFGKGYVQKGSLNLKEDYINNIIGIPDSQKRMMFLFK